MNTPNTIFADPLFIRRNTLLNQLYSHFKTTDFRFVEPSPNYQDVLRAIYHNLNFQPSVEESTYDLTTVYSIITGEQELTSDICWFYIERIIIHHINLRRPVQDRIISLLNRS